MKIETISHNDRYSIEQIASMFFTFDSEVEIYSEYIKGKMEIKTKVSFEGNEQEASFKMKNDDIKELKSSVKKSTYLAMKKITDTPTPWGALCGIRPTKVCRDILKDNCIEEAKKVLVDNYWVSDKKADFCIEVTENASKIISGIKENDVGIYVGVPFCPTRCIYCSFVSESYEVYAKYIPEYVKAVVKEVRATAKIVKEKGLNVSSVYIGGGTPPVLGERLLFEIIESLKNELEFSKDVEFTVEAGRPDVINKELLRMLKESGVNRLCINPQTMNDETLRKIGRKHTSYQTEKAFNMARDQGFDNINSDIIAGLTDEDRMMFENTLSRIRKLDPEGLTVHTMYLKRASKLSKSNLWNGESKEVSFMVDRAYAFAKENSYSPYYMYKQRSTLGNLENTGYAKKGYESLYNVFIMEEVGTILACGAGASSKLLKNGKIERVYNTKDVISYSKNIDEIIACKTSKIKSIL